MEKTLEQAVAQFNKNHPELLQPASKTAHIDVLAYKIIQTDEGEQVDMDSFEIAPHDLTVYTQKIFERCFISVFKSRHADTGYELEIYHIIFSGVERGACQNKVSLKDCEDVGIEVKKGKVRRISSSEAMECIKSGKYLIRIKNGNRYDPPAVATFKIGE